jgi:hypothetical protein
MIASTAFAGHPPKCPDVLVVFDSSSSMAQKVVSADGGLAPKYIVGHDAVNQLTAQQQGLLRFGLEVFPDNTIPGGCTVSSPTCFYPDRDAGCSSVECDFQTSSAIATVLSTALPGGGHTPTATAVLTAGKRADMQDATRNRYVLLVTDGLPVGCTANPVPDALAALNALRADAGVKSFVLGFTLPTDGGRGVGTTQLGEMALAGGEPRYPGCDGGTDAGPCYYNADDSQSIQAALSAIVQVVAGELGTTTCDPTCYAEGCPSGEICLASSCGPDPCSDVKCDAGSACVTGHCEAFCTSPCSAGFRCANGQCVQDQTCPSGCPGENQICIGGTCVENYCSGYTEILTCPPGDVCSENACVPSSGNSLDGGVTDGGSGSHTGSSCCTGAPGPFSIVALFLVLAFVARRRKSAASSSRPRSIG